MRQDRAALNTGFLSAGNIQIRMNRFSTSTLPLPRRLLALLLLMVVPLATAGAQDVAPPLFSTAVTGEARPEPVSTPDMPADSLSTAAVATPTDSADTAVRGVTGTVPESNSLEIEDFPRLEPSEYTYAGRQRYTLAGKMPYRETHIKSGTMMAFGGALLGLATAITWYQQAWYPDSTKAAFHFQTDWGYSKGYDKAGHMFGGWMASYCSYEAFLASGLSSDDAAGWGAAGGIFFQTFMEVQDGFYSYGFDWTDAVSNVIGAGYFYAQQRVPFLQNFDPKWSVGPTGRDSAREAAQIRSRIIVDDYDRQDAWLSAKVHNLLPTNLQPYWPKWLQLAVGAGARDVELRGYYAYRTLHIALDYDLLEMLPDMGSFGNWLVQGLNHFKLPAPALQVWPKVQFKLLYPFSL